jgi:hypothetical protein
MPDMTSIDPSILFAMLKGEPGTRKSTEALSFPTPQFWLSWDRKMNALMIPMKNWDINPKDVQYEDYDDWDKPRRKLEQLQTDCPFKTIIVDSVTSMADCTLRQTQQRKQGQTRKSGATAGKNIGGIPVMEIEDYNAEASAISEMIALLKDIHRYHRVNVILIAHVIQADYKSVTGETHTSRTIVTAAKKIAAKIPAYCGEVYHFNIEQGMEIGGGGKYGLLTEHTGDDFARTALPLPKKIVFGDDPLYAKYLLPAIQKLKPPTTPNTPIKGDE